MPDTSKDFNIHWVSQELKRNKEEAAPLLKKLYAASCAPLEIEEMYRVRSILEQYATLTNMLASDLAAPDPVEPPVWKKLFRR